MASEAEIREIAREAAKEAVAVAFGSIQFHATIENTAKTAIDETLTRLGFDMDKPREVQQDIAHLAKMRKLYESVGLKVVVTLVGIIVTAAAGMIATGAMAWFTKRGI